MSTLPLAFQALVWVYVLVAGGGLLICLWTVWAGLAVGRHRRSRWAAWRSLGAVLLDGVEWLAYGSQA